MVDKEVSYGPFGILSPAFDNPKYPPKDNEEWHQRLANQYWANWCEPENPDTRH